MKKNVFLILIILIVGNKIFGQISQEGTPRSFNSNKSISSFTKIPTIKMESIDKSIIEAIKQSNSINENNHQFAYDFSVNINVKETSVIDSIDVGIIYRLSIESDSAYSINLIFKKYILPRGAELYIYSENKEYILGAFTSRNNKASGRLPTMPVKGDKIIIEYFEPYFCEFEGELIVGKVNHDFLGIILEDDDIPDSYGNSGNCQVDINCPEGDDWQTEKRSVCRIIYGNYQCSGTLINNTSYDGTPYFLTANHCISTQENADDCIFIFNYESPYCGGGNGSTSQTIAGAELIANSSNSDFSLLKLSFKPFTSFNPYYAGWDRNNNQGAGGVCIHHPAGDVKKISTYTMTPINSYCESSNFYLIDEWIETVNGYGVTEGGSSGSPLFNNNHKVIGQLLGGCTGHNSNCTNPSNDYSNYGKFSVSWNQLKYWLDPSNDGVTSLNGANVCSDNSITGNDLNITHTISSGVVEIYKAKNTITATNTIESGATVTYEAGKSIHLKPGFHAKAGCNFVARIKPLDCVPGCDPISVVYSNYLTPNGDGTTDELCCLVDNANSFQIQVYNRWGDLVYSNSGSISGDIACVWDGSNSCSPCVYLVILTFTNDCDEVSKAYDVTVLNAGNKSLQVSDTSNIDPVLINIKLNNQFNDFDFNIYPNPTKGKFIIEINNKEANNYSLEIFNSVGISLYKIKNLTQNKVEIDKNTFPKGMYYIRLNNKNKIVTKKLIIN